MNEMNNGGNELNQNQEMSNVQVEQVQQTNSTLQQQNTNYQEQEVEPAKKSYSGLLVLFMIISLALAGYIVYDKVIMKEEIKEPEQKETTEKVNESTYAEDILKNKKSAKGNKYFKVTSDSKSINGKNVNIVLAFYVVEGESHEEDEVHYDVYINGKKGWEELLETYYAASGCMEDEETGEKCGDFRKLYDLYDEKGMLISNSNYSEDIKNKIQEIDETTIDSLFKVVKDSNKETYYLVSYDSGVGIAVVDMNGEIIFNERKATGRFTEVFDDIKNCTKTYDITTNPVVFESDAIYYLVDKLGETGNDEDNGKVNEYIITFNNGKINKELLKVCDAELLGAVRQ